MLLLVLSVSTPTSASTDHLHLDKHNHKHDHKHHHELEEHAIESFNHNKDRISYSADQEKSGDFGVLYIPCEVTGTKHQMKARGLGRHTLTNGSRFVGNLYQCAGCKMTVTTYYNYFNSGERSNGPGKYILASAPVFVDPSGYFFSGKYTLSGPATSWITGIFGSMSFST